VHAFTEFLAKLFGSRPRWDRTAIASAACFLTLRSPNLRSRLTALGKPETIALFSIDSNHRSGDEIEQSLVPEDSQHGTCLDPRHIGCGSWSCFCPRQNAADAEPNVVRAPGKYGRLPDPDAKALAISNCLFARLVSSCDGRAAWTDAGRSALCGDRRGVRKLARRLEDNTAIGISFS